ncbi:MAG TPA: RsbRD N-terminal domain-containing protein [Longimicrobiales bacterium]
MYQDEIGIGRSITDDCRIASPLAKRLRESRASLSLRWLERISARVNVAAEEVFPSQDLLDHVPLLVEAMADYLESPTEEGPTAERVIAKAAELGQMRYEQGFSPYQILKEFEVLGGIVLSYLARVADEALMECPPGEFMICAQRIHRSLALIQQATTARYLAMLETQASEREQRLRAVNELLNGPLRARLQETIDAARSLNIADPESWTNELRTQLEVLDSAIDQLALLSLVQPTARMQRNVPLKAAVGEAVRNLRDAARERGIEIAVPEDLPEIEVNAAAIELAVMVFLTTLLRHGERQTIDRRIEIRALGGGTPGESVVQVSVCDAGAVLPDEVRRAIEVAAPRNETVTPTSPPGISLAVAREAIESLGGRVALRVDDAAAATEFVLELPSRRAADQ